MKFRFLLTLLLLSLSSIVWATSTQCDFEVDGIYYDIYDATAGTVKVTYKLRRQDKTGSVSPYIVNGYQYVSTYKDEVNIPASVTYEGKTYKVVRIGGYAFVGRDITKITIPETVTHIGNYAFYGCSSLKEVILPNSVETIGNNSFMLCSNLMWIDMSDNVKSIGDDAFNNCTSIGSLTMPASLTQIGSNPFYNDKMLIALTVKATTPPAITSPGDNTFGKNYKECGHLFVPANSVELYRSAEGWKDWKYITTMPDETANRVDGDANNDGTVDVSDVTYVVDKILEKQQPSQNGE